MGSSPLPGTRSVGRAPKVSNAAVEANGYGALVGKGDAARNARGAASARDSAVASARRHNAAVNPGRVTKTAGEGKGVRPFAYGNGAHTGRPAAVGSGGLPGDINLGTRSQVNHNPFNTLAARTEGNNIERATAAIGNNKPIRPFPYGNGAHAGRPGPAGAGGLPRDINLGTRSQVNRNPFNTFGGATHVPPKPVGAGESTVTKTIVRDLEGAAGELSRTGKTTAAEGIMKTFKNNKALFIGAGVAVGAYAMMNRRGKGTSSGRSGMTRY